MSPAFDLTGKVALITGASRGIGEEIARTYAAAGARVVLASRKLEALEEVAESIRGDGGAAEAVAAHTGETAAVERMVAVTVERCGGLDILVNNAATNPHFGPLISSEDSHWDKTFSVNVKGYFHAARAAAAEMAKRGGGKILNVASIAGLEPHAGLGIYCVSKAAVVMLTRVLAAELGELNIQVNALAPGFIRTQFSSALWKNDELREKLVDHTPAGRFGTPRDLTGAALYLASPASDFTSGSILVVDGGFTQASPI